MEIQSTIQNLTQDLFSKLGFTVTVEVTPEGEGYYVHAKTEDDASMLIGRHARMLASLQRVLSAMFFKQLGDKMDILLDINDYRAGQKERLRNIAQNVAQRVIDEDRPARLASFSPYERRIIHEFVSENYSTLESHSEGEGQQRVLVIQRR
jgi:spoIIIJ-associated protein